MGIAELFMVAVGLSMDAFAVAMCKGLCMKKKMNYNFPIIIAAFFGGFQAIMPFLGWVLGKRFEVYITRYDHWVAFVLLGFIGGKMLLEAFGKDDESACACEEVERINIKELFVLAVATSIDALAVGITFAFLQVSIIPSVLLIGLTTFVISLSGVFLGNKFGTKFKSRAEVAGGLILVFIGVKILLEHSNILG
ncbi:MAG TPA: manganese efflux pump [Clostridiaceae bacterium]|jgi:putative Mn2+ efflux pump MntP|nr:manganese efflux pump [Clostridiaceae bacterium]